MNFASFMFKTGFSFGNLPRKNSFFQIFYRLNNEKILCTWWYCSVLITCISNSSRTDRTERTVEQLNFRKKEFLLFLIFLYLSYYYNYLIINYL